VNLARIAEVQIFGRKLLGNARNIAFWLVLFLLILALFNLFSGSNSTMQSRSVPYSEFVSAVDNGSVSRVTLDGETVRYTGSDGTEYTTIKPTDHVRGQLNRLMSYR